MKTTRLPALVGLMIAMFSLLAAIGAPSDQQAVQQAIDRAGAHWSAGPPFFTPAELHARLGFHKPADWAAPPAYEESVSIPSAYDWRNENVVTNVRDQGDCGSCWAFAAVGALESAAIIDGSYTKTLNLSEQYLVSDCYPGADCNGAWSLSGPAQFLVTTGTVDEACDPYVGYNTSCHPCSDWASRRYQASQRGAVSQTVDALKQALYQHGPLIVGMTVFTDFNYYEEGVYEHVWGGEEGGHAVLLVGYSDSGSYFIAKNSWSAAWGEDGYFRIDYGEVAGDTQFGADAQWLTFGSGGTPPTGSAPVMSYLRFYDGDELLYPPVYITPAQSTTIDIAFDYEDSDGNLDNGSMYLTIDGDDYLYDLPDDLGTEGALAFNLADALSVGTHHGSFYIEDTAGNYSNVLSFTLIVQTNPQPCAGNTAPEIVGTHYFIETVELSTPVEVEPGVELSVWFEYADNQCNLPGGELYVDAGGGWENLGTNPFFLGCSTDESGLYWGFYFDLAGAAPGDYEFEAYFTDICGAESNHETGSFTVLGGSDDDADDDSVDDDSDDDGSDDDSDDDDASDDDQDDDVQPPADDDGSSSDDDNDDSSGGGCF